MNSERFRKITGKFQKLRIAVIGDFCLDRYLEIDPSKKELSLETALPVHNVIRVRAQPGGAGTIVNNLSALGVGSIYPIGFCGDDGEGFELERALVTRPGVDLGGFIRTRQRRTFTYCKPLVIRPGKPPTELNRLDSKNWTPTSPHLEREFIRHLLRLSPKLNAVIIMDQVSTPGTGVVTTRFLAEVKRLASRMPHLAIIADSRQSLRKFPPVIFKMNRNELSTLVRAGHALTIKEVKDAAGKLAAKNRQLVFVTASEHGIIGASPSLGIEHVAALPLRGPIDIVGAGDAVTANLAAALAAGANLREVIELANAAASVVIHKLGTTGTASVREIWKVLRST